MGGLLSWVESSWVELIGCGGSCYNYKELLYFIWENEEQLEWQKTSWLIIPTDAQESWQHKGTGQDRCCSYESVWRHTVDIHKHPNPDALWPVLALELKEDPWHFLPGSRKRRPSQTLCSLLAVAQFLWIVFVLCSLGSSFVFCWVAFVYVLSWLFWLSC